MSITDLKPLLTLWLPFVRGLVRLHLSYCTRWTMSWLKELNFYFNQFRRGVHTQQIADPNLILCFTKPLKKASHCTFLPFIYKLITKSLVWVLPIAWPKRNGTNGALLKNLGYCASTYIGFSFIHGPISCMRDIYFWK